MRMTKEQKLMYRKIFIGGWDYEKEQEIDPKIKYYTTKYSNISYDEIEFLANGIWVKLLESEKEFNMSYFQMMLDSKIKNLYRNNKVKLSKEGVPLDALDSNGNPYSDRAASPEPEEAPEISWKEPLTEVEALMVECLKEGMTRREIQDKHKIYPNEQTAARKEIKRKMVQDVWPN